MSSTLSTDERSCVLHTTPYSIHVDDFYLLHPKIVGSTLPYYHAKTGYICVRLLYGSYDDYFTTLANFSHIHDVTNRLQIL
jgi:hypothetical protein